MISREVARNGGRQDHRAGDAETAAWHRARRPKACKLTGDPLLRLVVQDRLDKRWSPEQIAVGLAAGGQGAAPCEGWSVNNKRIRRLWRAEGLQVPTKYRKKRLAGIGTHVGAMSPIRPDALWAMDFQFDRTIDGRQVKMLNVIDEFTREALDIRVDRSITADDVVAVLERLSVQRGGPPAFVRFDNGPEFVAVVVAEWCAANDTDTVFIDPGSPWQNAWIESFNSRFRDELLNGWQFDSLLEARILIEDWRIDYNTNRPHSAHGDLTPAEFARQHDWTIPTMTTQAA